MSGFPVSYDTPSHRISLNPDDRILRDGRAVKITRTSIDGEIRVGCTVVSVLALKQLLKIATRGDILQEGDE